MHTFLIVAAGLVFMLAVLVVLRATNALVKLREFRLGTRQVKQYFIRGLSPQQRKRLKDASIAFGTTALDPDEGALFNRSYLPRVLKILDAELLSAFPLHGAAIYELTVHFRPPYLYRDLRPFGVQVRGKLRLIDRWKMKRLVGEILGPHLQNDVVVHLRAGVQTPRVDKRFHIFMGGTPKSSPRVSEPVRQICAAPFNDSVPFGYSGIGYKIEDKKSSLALGELVGQCLYLYADVAPRAHRAPNFGLLQRILTKVVEEIGTDSYAEDVSAFLASKGLKTESTAPVFFGSELTGKQARVLSALAKAALGPVVDKPIVVAHGHGQSIEPPDENEFGLFVYSAPDRRPVSKPAPELYGVRGLSLCPRFAPSMQGVVLCDEAGNTVGELLSNALYIYSNVLTTATAPELAVLTAIVTQAVKSMPLDNSPATIKSAVGCGFVNACVGLMAKTSFTSGGAYQAAQSRSYYHETMRQLVKFEQDLYSVQSQTEERFGKEYDALRHIAKIVDLRLFGDELSVTTVLLYCVNPGTRIKHEIGAFEINLNLKTGDVRWLNKTRRVAGHQAPHVGSSGQACLGNMSGVFSTLILGGQIPSAVDAAIGFVESVNHTDAWGKYITHYPKA